MVQPGQLTINTSPDPNARRNCSYSWRGLNVAGTHSKGELALVRARAAHCRPARATSRAHRSAVVESGAVKRHQIRSLGGPAEGYVGSRFLHRSILRWDGFGQRYAGKRPQRHAWIAGHSGLIVPIAVPQVEEQPAILQAAADEYVRRPNAGQHRVIGGHRGCKPNQPEKTQIDGMAQPE